MRQGLERSLVGVGPLGVGHLLGSTIDKVVLKPDVGDLIFIILVQQIDEVILHVVDLAHLGGGLATFARLGDPLGLGAHASLTRDAAEGATIEVLVVLDLLLVEAWVVRIGGLDLDNGLLVIDLVLVFDDLGLFAGCDLCAGPRRGGLRNFLLVKSLCLLSDKVVDLVDTIVSGGKGLGINAFPFLEFFSKESDVIDQHHFGGRVITPFVLLDSVEESYQVVLALARLGVDQLLLEERRWNDFHFDHKNTL